MMMKHMNMKMNKTSRSKRMTQMVKKRPNKATIQQAESEYHQKQYQHLQAQEVNTEEYSLEPAQIIAMTMLHYNTALVGMNDLQACSFLQTYSLKQGIKQFGSKGVAAAHKELQQLHNQVVFEPIHLNKMTTLERKRAMESLIFLNEK
jgi:hypothetical protein